MKVQKNAYRIFHSTNDTPVTSQQKNQLDTLPKIRYSFLEHIFIVRAFNSLTSQPKGYHKFRLLHDIRLAQGDNDFVDKLQSFLYKSQQYLSIVNRPIFEGQEYSDTTRSTNGAAYRRTR